MIKKIPVEELQVGMYIHDINLGWIDHPFSSKNFKLTSPKILQKILNLKVREVYIDTERGLDASKGQSASEVRAQVESDLEKLASPLPSKKSPTSVPIQEEWANALEIREDASRVVSKMMEDARLGKQIEIEQADPAVENIVDSIFRNQDALLGAIRIREMDQYTFEHSVSLSVLMVSFCKHMGMSQIELRHAGMGGLLHDVGKSRIPLEILNKPGKLTDEEFSIMRKHVEYSRDILKSWEKMSPISQGIIFEHHERFDGSGYPAGKKGNEISLYGQMAAVVDVYDALTSTRCYHTGKSPHWVLGKLIEWSKFHFNPEIVQRFIRCVGIYPIGTFVSLKSGKLAVVSESNEKDLLHPVVKLIFDTKRSCRLPNVACNLAEQSGPNADQIVGSEIPESYGFRVGDILNSP
ncbi:HD-GYP domain-containing protein [Gammaproteobacteria bacterium]